MNIPSKRILKTFIVLLISPLISMLFAVNAFAYEKVNTLKSEPKIVQIKARTKDDLLLFADYYQGGKRSGGVIVLHDCNKSRRSYRVLAKGLAEQGLHTILLDLRGYGDSLSPKYSQGEAKKKSTDIASYQNEMALIMDNWADDLLAAYQFLFEKIDKNRGVAVVASGCSGAYAVNLAEKIQLNSIVMITPKMTNDDKERYKNLVDIPSYFITSSHHQDSYETAQELFSWNGAKQSKLQVFKGSRYNSQLISRQDHLVSDIAFWVKARLR